MGQRLNLILGDQLNHDSLLWQDVDRDNDLFWMAEVSDESTLTSSSKQRTALFLSAMRHFAEGVRADNYKLEYITIEKGFSSLTSALSHTLSRQGFNAVRCVLPGDVTILTNLKQCCEKHHLNVDWLADNHFIAHPGEFSQWMQQRRQPRMEHWYRHLRQDRHILMQDQKPIGGQWNFDKDNRKAFGKDGPGDLPDDLRFKPDAITMEVMHAIEDHLPTLPGKLDTFNWPVTREQALLQLDAFISHRLPHFGDYQDAMWTEQPFLYHARIASSLNLKLLHPLEVIEAAELAYHTGHAPLNAVEGFIRQILGWREYIRGLYWFYRDDWLTFNALAAQRQLPAFYWDAQTEMHCMQQAISQVLNYGYGHHIQRLMVTGLFSLLWGVRPQAIHQWYLGMYVDAVAWVEIPNTIGMSQYADGGIVGSKPYIASGAYINRMSNYCQHCQFNPKLATGDKACPFTTLYWHFVDEHQTLLAANPRLGMQVKNWHNKSDAEQQQIRLQAQKLFAEFSTVDDKEQE